MKDKISILAELYKEDLEDIYELTYKYGWLTAIEREEGGWLPDKAYMEKARIEQELKPLIDSTLETMVEKYDEWLIPHGREGWIEEQREIIGEGSPYFPPNWNIDIMDNLYGAVVSGLGYSDRDWLIEVEDPGYLIETYGEQVLTEHAETLPENEGEELLDKIEGASGSGPELEEIMREQDIDIYTIIDKMLEEGWTLEDHFREVYTPENLILVFGKDKIDWDIILEDAYRQYLDNFPGLEDEIEEIEKTKSTMEDALKNGDLSEKILAFQVGLTTAHHHGEMVEHVLEDIPPGRGEGKQILDELSNMTRTETKEWDKYLERIIGRPLYYTQEEENA